MNTYSILVIIIASACFLNSCRGTGKNNLPDSSFIIFTDVKYIEDAIKKETELGSVEDTLNCDVRRVRHSDLTLKFDKEGDPLFKIFSRPGKETVPLYVVYWYNSNSHIVSDLSLQWQPVWQNCSDRRDSIEHSNYKYAADTFYYGKYREAFYTINRGFGNQLKMNGLYSDTTRANALQESEDFCRTLGASDISWGDPNIDDIVIDLSIRTKINDTISYQFDCSKRVVIDIMICKNMR